MNKHERDYRKIQEFKQRFKKLPSETIRDRLNFGSLFKEAAIAYREILEERGEGLYHPVLDTQPESTLEEDTSPLLINFLGNLKRAALASEFSKNDLISGMENLLLWLNLSENNTDKNCKQIDYFISLEIIGEEGFKEIPEDIQNILFDMGATLHDTHTTPKMAENYESTPAQLLVRVQNLY